MSGRVTHKKPAKPKKRAAAAPRPKKAAPSSRGPGRNSTNPFAAKRPGGGKKNAQMASAAMFGQ